MCDKNFYRIKLVYDHRFYPLYSSKLCSSLPPVAHSSQFANAESIVGITKMPKLIIYSGNEMMCLCSPWIPFIYSMVPRGDPGNFQTGGLSQPWEVVNPEVMISTAGFEASHCLLSQRVCDHS